MIDDMRPRPRHASEPEPIRRPMPQYEPRLPSRPDFRTPQEIAAEEGDNPTTDEPEEEINMAEETFAPKAKKPRRSLKEWLKSRTKKQWVIIIVIAVLVLGGASAGAYFLFFHKKAPVVSVTKPKKNAPAPVKPTTVASTLTGLQVAPDVNKRPVTAVMIENSTDARPQSGLDQAGVVFEAVAEGGITRFEALFQDTQPAYLGPVRSVRPYYIQWGMGFDAAIAHVGGSPEALQDMKDWKAKDLDQFANGNYYQRINSRDAPHNVYTSIDQLNQIESNKGYGQPSFTGFLRKNEQPAKTPTAKSIDVNISSSLFNSHYDYDPSINAYSRAQAGAPHMVVDKTGTQTQIKPKVVVVLTMSQGLEADDHHTSYGTIGTGHAYIFQDGIATEGTWKKNSSSENFTFTDNSGKAIALNPGQTWVSIVGDTSYVSYK